MRATPRARSILPGARYDFVRAGIGIYGVAPAPALAGVVALQPALAVKARVTFVKTVAPGTRISYGLRYETDRETRIATVPIGYADGVPRVLGHAGGSALGAGVRCPMAGTVTMDQLMLDVGEVPVEPGDEVVLLGRQGDEVITADEWAALAGTIPYEIVCGIGPRRAADVHPVNPRRARQGSGVRGRSGSRDRGRRVGEPATRGAEHPARARCRRESRARHADLRRLPPRHTRPRHDPRRRVRRGSADHAVARRDALSTDVVPPARAVAEGGLPRDRVRPSRPRRVGRSAKPGIRSTTLPTT